MDRWIDGQKDVWMGGWRIIYRISKGMMGEWKYYVGYIDRWVG